MATSEDDDSSSFLALIKQMQQALDRGVHLHLCRDDQLWAVQSMADAILRIRRNINSLAPVQRLPTELLTLVFEHAIFPDERVAFRKADWYREDLVQPHCADIVQVTHVCHAWRSAALATPRLWMHIDNSYHPAKLAAFLSRSQAAPLTLQFSDAEPSYLTRLVEICGDRLHRLDITRLQGVLILRSLPLDWSRLECATISAGILESMPLLGDTGSHTELTPFQQSISSLKGLAIGDNSGCWVPLTHFPNLTHLCLTQLFNRIQGVLLRSLATLVANAPRLQVLHLAWLPVTSSCPTAELTLQPIALPYLKLFVCSSSRLDTSLRLLSLLQVPEHLHVHVDHHPLPSTELLVEHFPYSRGWIDGLNHLEVTIAANMVRVIAEGDRSGVWIEGWQNPLDLRHWCGQLEALLPLKSIESLDFFVESEEADANDLLQGLLYQLPSLATIRFPVCPPRPIPRLSGFRDRSYIPEPGLFFALTPGNGVPATCPNLTTVYVEAGTQVLKRLSPAITEMLAARAHAGVSVKSLTLRVLDPARTDAPWLRTVFRSAASHVGELNLDLESEGATRSEPMCTSPGALWDLSADMEKYWIVPDSIRPPWLLEYSP